MGAYPNSDALVSPYMYGIVDAGPTLGKVRRPMFPIRIITGNATLEQYDFQLIVKPTPAASVVLSLLPVETWLRTPGGGLPILVQDQMQVATNGKTITIVPNGTEKINGQTQWQIGADYASLVLRPLVDLSGWSAQ